MFLFLKNCFGHLKTILIHKYWVFYYGCKLGIPIRAFFHDFSKFHPIEFFESVKYYQGGKSSPINAAKADKGYSLAWQHHKGRNPHHYEHWTDRYDTGVVPIKMPFKYVIEMIADYLGAARAYMGKDFTLEKEWEWWRNKLETYPLIHEETRNLVSFCFYNFLCTNSIYTPYIAKDHYKRGLFKTQSYERYYSSRY